MTALAYDTRRDDPDLSVDPSIDEFIDELFAATPRRRHLTVVRSDGSSARVVRVQPADAQGRHAVPSNRLTAPMWVDAPMQQPRTRRGLLRLFLRTFQLVVLLGVALAMVVSMFPVSVDATDVDAVTTIHVVQEGDTLWNLAAEVTPVGQDVGATIAAIREANDLPSSMLIPGEQLVLPAANG